MKAIATCIKETGNWSKIKKEHKFDHPDFSVKAVAEDITVSSPKLNKLIEKINELDALDMKKDGRKYKHFIYSDVKSAYGAKLIASALAAHGFHHAYGLEKSKRGMSFKIKSDLKKHKGNVFATLTSVLFFEKSIGVTFRRELLGKFNARPDNIFGEEIRIIILDSGFREGVDLFDVKYVHLFEPIVTKADQKQAIGRATRFCGQKGLHFERQKGWPIYVYRYETIIPKAIQTHLISQNKDLDPGTSFFDLFMKFSNIDPKKLTLANELEPLIILSAVDRYLTRSVHNFSIKENVGMEYWDQIMDQQGGKKTPQLTPFQKMQNLIRKDYIQYSWPPTKIENGCESTLALGQKKGPVSVEFSPTQNFVRNFFTVKSPYKGMLLMHSVGTGKTCTAIATASSSFEKEGYTIIYVTRHTLKADVWKNMFGLTCSVLIQEMITKGTPIPETEAARLRLIERWMEPMSYKQFSNTITGKNSLYEDLVKRNGKEDPLNKTLIIIDEAHKLHAPDVAGSEKPDVDAISKAFQHSYKISGKDSVRVLLMTATPYTDDPMDMMKLINLLRPERQRLPEDFDKFSDIYLDNTGKFTESGRQQLLNELTGNISYLNREKDVRSFSYPVIKDIQVPLSEYDFTKDLNDYVKNTFNVQSSKSLLTMNISDSKRESTKLKQQMTKDFAEMMQIKRKEHVECVVQHKEKVRDAMVELNAEKNKASEDCKSIVKECKDEINKTHRNTIRDMTAQTKHSIAECKNKEKLCKYSLKDQLKNAIQELKADAKHETQQCARGDTQCRNTIKQILNESIASLKAESKIAEKDCVEMITCNDLNKDLKDALQQLKLDLTRDLKTCIDGEKFKKCMENAKEQYESQMKQIKNDDTCIKLKQDINAYTKNQRELLKFQLKEKMDIRQSKINFDKKLLAEKQQNLRGLNKKIKHEIATDKSQQLRLEHCLKSQKVKPMYQEVLRGKQVFNNADVVNNNDAILSSIKSNVYLINGHGSEQVEDFDRRQTMPQDKVLVVFPVCGRPNWMNIVCKFMDMYNDPTNIKLMCDPLKFKSKIERMLGYEIRIYLPGDKVPFMSTNMFYDFDLTKTVLLKSGVYDLCNVPSIDRSVLPAIDEMNLNLGDDSCGKYIGMIENAKKYSNEIHQELFKGSLYPSSDDGVDYDKLHDRHIDIQQILKTVGSGIYYYTGCRSSSDQIQNDRYAKMLANSYNQQETQHRSVIMNEFKKHLKIEKVYKQNSPMNISPKSSMNVKSQKQNSPMNISPKSSSPKQNSPNIVISPKNSLNVLSQKQNSPTNSLVQNSPNVVISPKNSLNVISQKQNSPQQNSPKQQHVAKEKKQSKFTNSLKERKRMNEITDKTLEFVANMINTNKTILNKKLESWIVEVQAMVKSETTNDVIVLLEDVLKLVNNDMQFVLKLSSRRIDGFYEIKLYREYKIEKRRYKVIEKRVGIIPEKARNTSSRCSAKTVLRRLKRILDKGKIGSVTMLKTSFGYDDPSEFEALCKMTKDLIRKHI